MIGVGIIAFDRPHYLVRTLAGISNQRCAREVDVHLFLDGAVNPYSRREAGKQMMIDQCARMFKRSKLGTVHAQDQNLGIGLHQYAATEWMVSHYDRVMMIEDDVVLSPHWLRLAGVLLDQFADRPSVFGVSPGFRRLGPSLDTVRAQFGHWWCEAFTAQAWRRIRTYYRDYLAIIRGVDYRQRDHDAIRAMYREHGWNHPATSQDAAKDLAIKRAGMVRLVCEVNRAIGIGRNGQHFTPELFARGGFEGQTPYTFDGDATRRRFDEPFNT